MYLYNLSEEVSGSLVVKFFEKQTENHRAMFSVELCKSVRAELIIVSLRQQIIP